MGRLVRWIQRVIKELRRRRVIRVAVVYAGTAFVILQLGEILVQPFGLPGWTLRLLTFLLILGFPLAIGLAWVYNITEEGVVRDLGEGAALEGTPSGSPFTSNGLIVGLLIFVAGLLLYPRVFSPEEKAGGQTSALDTAQVEDRSIAVLPFANLSGTEKARPLTRGLHDDLLTRLSNVSDLKVISRTSVEKYRDTDLSLPAIADSLGVRWIVEGGVQRAGGKIQVNAQLIDPRSDVHRWAGSYQRDLSAKGLFAIQGEIAGEIADALKAKLTPGEQSRITGAPTENLQAYRLYVQGRRLLASRRPDSIRRAKRYFRQALQRDSTFALAWAGLADAHVYASAESGVYRTESGARSAEKAAERALELSPDLAEAHVSRAIVYIHEQLAGTGQRNGPTALRHLRRAVELKPSYAPAHGWLGILLLMLGRPEDGLEHASLAAELTPGHYGVRSSLEAALLSNRKYEAALAEAERHLNRYPERIRGLFYKYASLAHLKRWADIRQLARQRRSGTDVAFAWTGFFLALADVATGDSASARRRIQKLRAEGEERQALDDWQALEEWQAALLHAALGELDTAFRILPKIEEWPIWPHWKMRYYYPNLLSAFRADPRYEKLIRELNEAWGLNPDGSLPEDSDDLNYSRRSR